MQFHAIPCIIANVTKKHVSEDDIMFTFGSGVKGLMSIKFLPCKRLKKKYKSR